MITGTQGRNTFFYKSAFCVLAVLLTLCSCRSRSSTLYDSEAAEADPEVENIKRLIDMEAELNQKCRTIDKKTKQRTHCYVILRSGIPATAAATIAYNLNTAFGSGKSARFKVLIIEETIPKPAAREALASYERPWLRKIDTSTWRFSLHAPWNEAQELLFESK